MNLYETIKQLANEKELTIAEIERQMGISNGQIRKWQIQTPGIDKLRLVADYFQVSTDYLLGRCDTPQLNRSHSNVQLDLTVEEALSHVVSYDGKPVTDLDRKILMRISEAYLDTKA